MADVAATLAGWSSTTASNSPAGSTSIGTGLDDNLREIQGVITRGLSHKGADIASVAGTTDIGAVEGLMHDITGALAITGLGTVRAGILKVLKFEGAATLTHNATSLILPGAANIVCADGDVGVFISEGSGNWRCLGFTKANGSHLGPVVGAEVATTSGTAVSISTTVPPWAKKITLTFEGVSSSGTSPWMLQIGDSGGLETTGYAGRALAGSSGTTSGGTNGFHLQDASVAANVSEGQVVLVLKDAANFTWSMTGNICYVGGEVFLSAGTKSLSAALDRVSITTNGGADTFDAGSIGIMYE